MCCSKLRYFFSAYCPNTFKKTIAWMCEYVEYKIAV